MSQEERKSFDILFQFVFKKPHREQAGHYNYAVFEGEIQKIVHAFFRSDLFSSFYLMMIND